MIGEWDTSLGVKEGCKCKYCTNIRAIASRRPAPKRKSSTYFESQKMVP